MHFALRFPRSASLCAWLTPLFLTAPARAAGVLGTGANGRITEESVLVVWDAGTRESHVLYAARTTNAQGAVVVFLPEGARLAAPLPNPDAAGSMRNPLCIARRAAVMRSAGTAPLCGLWNSNWTEHTSQARN